MRVILTNKVLRIYFKHLVNFAVFGMLYAFLKTECKDESLCVQRFFKLLGESESIILCTVIP